MILQQPATSRFIAKKLLTFFACDDPEADVVERLAYICQQEGFELDEQSLSVLARAATGSLRDAINLLEQVVSSHGPKPSLEQVQDELGMAGDARAYQLAHQLFEKDLAGCLATVTAVVDEGVELKRFLRDIKEALRSTLMAASGASASLDLGKEQMEQVAEIAELAGSDEATRALKVFGQVELKDTGSSLPLELAAAEYIVQANQRAEVAASAARLSFPPDPPPTTAAVYTLFISCAPAGLRQVIETADSTIVLRAPPASEGKHLGHSDAPASGG